MASNPKKRPSKRDLAAAWGNARIDPMIDPEGETFRRDVYGSLMRNDGHQKGADRFAWLAYPLGEKYVAISMDSIFALAIQHDRNALPLDTQGLTSSTSALPGNS